MRYDRNHPDPAVEVRRRLGDLRDQAKRADGKTGRSHVQTARLDQAAPSTTSTSPVAVYALTVVGDPNGSLIVLVDASVSSGTAGMVGILDSGGDLLASTPVGGADVGRLRVGPVSVGLNDRSLAIWRTSGTGALTARLIAAWVPDV